VRVRGHRAHYLQGPPVEFTVLYRPKDYPRGTRHFWQSGGLYRNDDAAERRRRALMARGYRAVVERSGGGLGLRKSADRLEELARDSDERRGREASRRASRRGK
jgi:hypothetical protein